MCGSQLIWLEVAVVGVARVMPDFCGWRLDWFDVVRFVFEMGLVGWCGGWCGGRVVRLLFGGARWA